MAKKKKRISEKISDTKYTIYTDGGCAYNPGGPGGIGVVVINNETKERVEISKGYKATTNNRMEILAVIEGLKVTEPGASITLYSDSQYTLNCMSGVWSKKKNIDLWEILNPLQKERNIELNWVKGHNKNKYNERCDALATGAMQSDEKVDDEGYRKMKENGRAFYEEIDRHLEKNKKGAMAVQIVIPEELCDIEPEFMSKREYEKLYNVKYDCAKSICDFYTYGDKSFKSYIPLKTGGIDSHSRKKIETIAEKSPNPELYIETIKKYFDNEKDINAAARWNSRGLSLYDSIRKILVDREIRQNAIGKR